MRKPNAEHKNMRREEILAAAAILFAEKNYHEVLMSDVAKKAHVAKGSIYNYFSNKEDLYTSIITHRLELLLQLLRKRIDEQATPAINLRRIIIHTFSFMIKYPHFFQIWYKEKLNCARISHSEIRHLYQQIKMLLRIALEKGRAAGVLAVQDDQFASEMILGMIDSAVLMCRYDKRSFQQETSTRMFDLIVRLLDSNAREQFFPESASPTIKNEEQHFAVEQ